MSRKTTKELEAEWEASQLKKDGLTKEAYIRLSRESATVNGHQTVMDDVSTVGWGRAYFNLFRKNFVNV